MHQYRTLFPTLTLLLLGLFVAAAPVAPARGQLSLSAGFADHMVLQQDMPVPVWGTAEPGEQVFVRFAGQEAKAAADDQGRWRVTLEPMQASVKPQDMTVAGASETIELGDLLIGELWLMVGGKDPVKVWGPPVPEHLHGKISRKTNPLSDKAIAEAKLPEVRIRDEGKWLPVSPSVAGDLNASAFYFARTLHQDLQTPVGVIHIPPGVGQISALVPKPVLESDPELAAITLDPYRRHVESMPQQRAAYEQALAEYEKLSKKQRRGKQAPEPPLDIADPSYPGIPGRAFDKHLAPLAGMAIRGFILEHGGSSTWGLRPVFDYEKLLPALIRGWRQAWDAPDKLFLIVQGPSDQPTSDQQPRQPAPNQYLQELQRSVARATDNVGLVVQADFVHYDDRAQQHQMLGKRLALAAEAYAYGVNTLPAGPSFESMQVKDGKAYLSFSATGGRLRTRGNKLEGFVIAGDDRDWHWAQAEIVDDDQIVVWSEDVPEPAAVRYGLSEGSPISLINAQGLPASPFRTDDWSLDIPARGEHKAVAAAAARPPKIDGQLGEGEWPGQPLTDFVIRHTYRTAEYPTRVWLAYDDEHLYVGGEAAMASSYPIARVREPDQRDLVFDDAVELLLDLDRDLKDYYRIAINPRGVVLDGIGFNNSVDEPWVDLTLLRRGRGFSTEWDSQAQVKTGLGDEAWVFEMAIPWRALGLDQPPAGKPLGLQLIRAAPSESFVAGGQHEQMMKAPRYYEWSQWVNTGRGYHTGAMLPYERHVHRPARFGTLTLEP